MAMASLPPATCESWGSRLRFHPQVGLCLPDPGSLAYGGHLTLVGCGTLSLSPVSVLHSVGPTMLQGLVPFLSDLSPMPFVP